MLSSQLTIKTKPYHMSIKKFLKNEHKDFGLFVLRMLAGGFMLLGHGLPKLMRYKSDFKTFADPLGIGSEYSYILTVFAEVGCSSLIILGLFTRFAAIPLIITMAVAVLIVHAEDPWHNKEFALMYAVPYITLYFSGGGKFSVDENIFGR